MDEVHSIFVGSQHPIGVALVSRANKVGEGDGVIIEFIISEQSGSPGVHEPLEGSQHRIPFKLVSPVFWLKAPTINADT
jgi:hypothetical protein